VNLRLARLQLAGLGHPATMHSPFVDGVLVEEDFIGDPECFSERLVALSPGSMPFRPPAHWPPIRRATPTAGDGVRIAVAASPMKINAPFLAALREIASAARARVQFRFFSAGLAGLGKIYLQNLVRSVLPGAVVNPDLPGDRYLEALGECDLFVNPFPFGNTNGIVDTMRLGLPGVCMSGPEVHTHIDEALFRRFGLPEWLIARSVAEYVHAAVRLVDDAGEREALGKLIRRSDVEAVLFRGEPQRFVNAVEWLRTTLAQETAALPKLLRPPLEPRPARSGTAGSA
jgi:predicted O-linked N-acetylglucosamine transferase (SPINDLY family)